MATPTSGLALRSRLLASAARGSRFTLTRQQQLRYARFAGPPPRRRRGGLLKLLGLGGVAGAAFYGYKYISHQAPPAEPQQAPITFEKPRKHPVSKEANRDQISPQHLQVKKSWESPGVYAWGSNAGRVVAPDSDEPVIKTPRRISHFDGQLLRDLKLDHNFGAAITENGDLVQWGAAFSKTNHSPTVTLKGKDLVKVSLSKDRIIALSSSGEVFSVPVSAADQSAGQKPLTSSRIPFWSSPAAISYRNLSPGNLGLGEKVVDISSGLEHCLLLTSSGRVFAAASSTDGFPDRGQLGVPGLTWATRPKEVSYDQPHELRTVRNAAQIATGDFHSLVLDKGGNLFSFGDNSAGQLGFEPEPESPHVDAPLALLTNNLYSGTAFLPRVTSIAAGGLNSYFTVDAVKPAKKGLRTKTREPGEVVADTWACGEGLHGSLGTGKWTHISTEPTKIKALSNLSEFDEKRNKIVPIGLSNISVGSTHACAVLGNETRTTTSRQSSDNDTNWGLDVLWWGGNERYQLGTGRRSNVCTPTYIGPLDADDRGDSQRGTTGDVNRFQIAPRTTTRLGEGGKGRKATVEQRVECGRFATAVYSAT